MTGSRSCARPRGSRRSSPTIGRRAARVPPSSPATVVDLAESGAAKFKFLYPDEMPLLEKVRTIAQRIYGAADIEADKPVTGPVRPTARSGLWPFPGLHRQDPVQLYHRPQRQGRAERPRPSAVREVRLSAGAEFVVAICGDIMTMPGLPRVPAANNIEVDAEAGASPACSESGPGRGQGLAPVRARAAAGAAHRRCAGRAAGVGATRSRSGCSGFWPNARDRHSAFIGRSGPSSTRAR